MTSDAGLALVLNVCQVIFNFMKTQGSTKTAIRLLTYYDHLDLEHYFTR